MTAPPSDLATMKRPGGIARSTDPNGRLDVTKHAGYWLRDDKGNLTRRMRHICWGWLHVPQCRDGAAGDLEQGAGGDAESARSAWLVE